MLLSWTGRLAQTIVQGNCLFKVMGQEVWIGQFWIHMPDSTIVISVVHFFIALQKIFFLQIPIQLPWSCSEFPLQALVPVLFSGVSRGGWVAGVFLPSHETLDTLHSCQAGSVWCQVSSVPVLYYFLLLLQVSVTFFFFRYQSCTVYHFIFTITRKFASW